MHHFDQVFLDEMKKALLAEKNRIDSEIGNRATASPNEADQREAAYTDYGDKPEDNAVEVAEYDVTLNVETTLEEQLARVEAALQRLTDGTYGIDEETGMPISQERLRANPTATSDIRPEQT